MLNRKHGFAALMGATAFTAGIATERVVSAQSAPPAYYVNETQTTDAEAIKPYLQQAPGIIEKYGGKYLARGGKVDSLEGDAPKGRIIIIAFKSLDDVRRWYNAPEYQAIVGIRHKAASSRVYAVEGLPN